MYANVLKFHIWISHEKEVARIFFLSELFACTKYKERYCSHPGCPRARLHSRHTVLQFFKCLYLNSNIPQNIHIWNVGAWEGRLRFHKNRPLGSCPGVGLGFNL